MMKLVVKENYDESSRYLADIFAGVIREKPDALIGLATGSSPMGLYDCLASDYETGRLDLSHVRTVNLDEYIGLPRSHEQSFGYYMDRHFFSRVNIDPANVTLFNGAAADIGEEIASYDRFLEENIIDVMVVGIGTNGHIGFNEPDAVFQASAHSTRLTEETIKANSRFFENADEVPKTAATMGMSGIVRARKVVLIATGEAKADAIARLLADDLVDPMLPCSMLKLCRDATVLVDRALYKRMTKRV